MILYDILFFINIYVFFSDKKYILILCRLGNKFTYFLFNSAFEHKSLSTFMVHTSEYILLQNCLKVRKK